MKKLKTDTLQFEALVKIYEAATKHYAKEVKDSTNIIDLANNQFRYDHLSKFYNEIFKLLNDVRSNSVKQYTVDLTNFFGTNDALVVLSSVIPVNNNDYYSDVKQTLVDYCTSLLKYKGLIPNNPTYRLNNAAPDAPVPYVNKSTTFHDFLEY